MRPRKSRRRINLSLNSGLLSRKLMLKIRRTANGSRVYGEWSNGLRKHSRVGKTVSVGSESSHDLGLKRPNPCESGWHQLSRALRSGRNHAQELPSIHPRVDQGTARRELALKQALMCTRRRYRDQRSKEMATQPSW